MRMLESLAIGIPISLWLAGCSTVRPADPPRIVECPKPQISLELLQPADLKALRALKSYLSMPETNPNDALTSSTPSSPN